MAGKDFISKFVLIRLVCSICLKSLKFSIIKDFLLFYFSVVFLSNLKFVLSQLDTEDCWVYINNVQSVSRTKETNTIVDLFQHSALYFDPTTNGDHDSCQHSFKNQTESVGLISLIENWVSVQSGKNIKIRSKLGTRGKFGFTPGPVFKTIIIGIVIKLVMLLLLYI